VSQRSPAQRSATQSAGDAWPAPMVGRGHRTIRCAPDCLVCTEQCPVRQLPWSCNGRLRQKRKEIGTGPSIVTVRWHTGLSGAPLDRRQDGLPCLPPTAPSCLGAIKGTPRRMEELPKLTRNILRLQDSNFTHSIL
jgi:hypothetical protein